MSEWKSTDPFEDTQPLTGAVPTPGPATTPLAIGQPVLVHIGEIQVTADTIYTPTGQFPLSGSHWHVQDQWTQTQKTPTWAIMCAIFGFCVLTVFSLFFLLAKETVTQGFVMVTVTNGPHTYTARFPVGLPVQVGDVHNRVNYARSLASR